MWVACLRLFGLFARWACFVLVVWLTCFAYADCLLFGSFNCLVLWFRFCGCLGVVWIVGLVGMFCLGILFVLLVCLFN